MTDRPSVLVPIRVLEGESIPEGVPELLANAHVVLLGYHEIPEQTAPGQARMQFEERAQRKLESIRALPQVDDVFVHVDPREAGEWKADPRTDHLAVRPPGGRDGGPEDADRSGVGDDGPGAEGDPG